MSSSFDVIVAGAGPVGLFLACELATAGISVLVLERDAEPDSPWKTGPLGRRGLNVRAVEAFYRRRLMDKVLGQAGPRPATYEKTTGFNFAGHFAGIMLDGNKIDFSRWKYHLPGPSSFPGRTSLSQIETALSEQAQALGIEIRRGVAVSKAVEEGDTVKVWAGDQVFSAEWLVGCDGGRSTIRKAAGFEFEGTDAEFTGYAAMADFDRPELLKLGFNYTKSGMYIVVGPGNVTLIDFDMSFDRTQAITKEHFQTVLRRVTNTDIVVKELHHASSFTDRSKQVTQYRKGRVLLAGDSAHIHSPLGAQGLNLGICDAINLGWKLAATVKGHAAPGLLDTYHQERHPIAAWVLEWTRAQVSALRPDPFGESVYKIMRDMIDTVDGTNYFVDRVWGLSQRYDLGDAHPLVGASVPDFEFEDGVRLGTKTSKARFAVIDFEGNPSVAEFAKSSGSLLDYYSVPSTKETLGLKGLLVRPDGIVASVAEGAIDVEAFKVALSRWLRLPAVETEG